ncbi:MAG TPA: DUF4166 domain-containing protein [Candidatus Cybelea sp.]|nr:DUF4166 domain-containing protein [Candidatus Cybelea sp.]
MRRILVLGGYGTFGGRVVRLLAKTGRFEIAVAGRSRQRAEAFVRELDNSNVSAMALDREALDAAKLQSLAPWLVIDASGPFQAQDHRVVKAALGAGAHYIDLADAIEFVTGIGAFDAEAKARGLTVISGASSVPTLSSAVIAALAEGLDVVLEIEIAISSSNQATLGRSVHAALLSYAGRPVPIRRFGRPQEIAGLVDWRTVDIAVPGRPPLKRRLVAPCAVPDLVLLPQRYPALHKLIFRAGTELPLLNRGGGILAWLVSRRVLRSVAGLADPAGAAFTLLRRFGSRRSGMLVEVTGRRGGAMVARHWNVIAEQGDGLFVPAMASALLAAKLDRGELPSGAMPGIELLTLAEFRAVFAAFDIHDAIAEAPVAPSPFRRWLGDAVDRLPPAIRCIHDDPLERSASGAVAVTRGTQPIARWLCRMLGFPESATDRPLLVEFEPEGNAEVWRRRFGTSTFASRLGPWPGRPGHVREQIGPLAYGFELVTSPEGLRMEFRRWWLCGLPLPRVLGPRVDARQWEEDGAYCFSVDVAAPGIGRVIAYAGRLKLSPLPPPRPSPESGAGKGGLSSSRCTG